MKELSVAERRQEILGRVSQAFGRLGVTFNDTRAGIAVAMVVCES